MVVVLFLLLGFHGHLDLLLLHYLVQAAGGFSHAHDLLIVLRIHVPHLLWYAHGLWYGWVHDMPLVYTKDFRNYQGRLISLVGNSFKIQGSYATSESHNWHLF